MTIISTAIPKTYRLQSSPFLNAPGMIAWAKNGYKFERDRKNMIDVVCSTWPTVSREAAAALLSEAAAATIDGDVVVFTEPEPEPDPDADLKEYTVRLAASARVFNEDTIMATSIEDAIAKARQINLEEYRWGYRYDHEDGIDGDQIAYVIEADDIEGDEVEVDLRDEGEPFSWEACQIVKDIAKVAAKPDTTTRDEEILALMERAVAACTKGE
ncbi:MAG: hypothetical protein WA975_18130 [Mesorhizobium sp.]